MGLFWDWNSITSVNRAQNWCFWIGILFFFLVLVFEMVSHVFSNRKDALVEIGNIATSQEAKEKDQDYQAKMAALKLQISTADERAEEAKKSAAESNKQAAEASERTAKLTKQIEEFRRPRAIGTGTNLGFDVALRRVNSSSFVAEVSLVIVYNSGDWESRSYASQLRDAINANAPKIKPPVVRTDSEYGNCNPGIHIATNYKTRSEATARAANTLSGALEDMNVIPELTNKPNYGNLQTDDEKAPPDCVLLKIGPRIFPSDAP
jgi:hypothetical protein